MTACAHQKATTEYDLLLPGAIRATCPECGAKTDWLVGSPEQVIGKLRGGEKMDDAQVQAQVQPVDTRRVEIKQAANGSIQVSARATDKASEDDAEWAAQMAVRAYETAHGLLRGV